MRSTRISGSLICLALVALTLSAIPSESASPSRSAMIVDTEWLASHLNDQNLVILQVGKRDTFDAGHIPGAQFIELRSLSLPREEGALILELPPPDQLRATFEGFGISDSSRIVLCFGDDWVTPTTRVFFTLDYLGLGDRASLLDGGLNKWIAEKRPTSTEVRARDRGKITTKPNPELVADAVWVKEHLNQPNVAIIDARSPEFYNGTEKTDNPRQGHIQGAMNLPFTKIISDPNLVVLSDDALRALFRDAGADPGDQIVTYCHIGQQASLVYFAARALGYKVKIYDGSFQDWSARKELPVAAASMTSCEQKEEKP